MKKITITNAFSIDKKVRHSNLIDIFAEGTEEMDASDGYHTFEELYDHRIQLFIVLCNVIYSHAGFYPTEVLPWKSKVHSDGTSWDGCFIAGINREKGKQITYHLPIDRWDELRVVALDKAPEWDGHTPADVIERLKSIA